MAQFANSPGDGGYSPAIVDMSKIHFTPAQTVIENVFGSSPSYDYLTGQMIPPNSQDAYDRHYALNPPIVIPSIPLPSMPSLNGLKADGILGVGILVLLLALIIKIFK